MLEGDILIKKRKITLFRFWPKDQLRNAWRNYILTVQEDENLNAAYLIVQVLEKVCEQFIHNCIKKQNKKAAKVGQQNEVLGATK